MLSDEVYVMQVDSVEQSSNSSLEIDRTVDSEVFLKPPITFKGEYGTSVNDTLNKSDADDGQQCPICFDNWTSTGDHRLCSLKCGHLFGYSCINHWLSSQKEKNCPSCKKKTCRSEIRFIYARKLIVVDNCELETVKKQLTNVIEEKNLLQIELTKAVCRERALQLKVKELQDTVENLNISLETSHQFDKCSQTKVTNNFIKLYMEKCVEICKESGCRVLDCFSKMDLIVASMKSPNVLFPGFGIRKINISNFKPTAYVPLHLKPIRDLKFHYENPWLLSVSLDKTAKIIDSNTTAPICIYNSESPLWSCGWDRNNLNLLYVGQQNGTTIILDTRKISEPVDTLKISGDISPVISVSSVVGGSIIICKLNSLWTFRKNGTGYNQYLLPLDGPFVSMNFEIETQQLLVSTRPNSQHLRARHHLCHLETNSETGNLLSRNIHCLQGSTSQKFLSRSCFVSCKSNYCVAAYQESNKSVYLWNIKTGNRECYVPAPEPVLDLCGFNVFNTDFMLSLTERKLMFYKFV